MDFARGKPVTLIDSNRLAAWVAEYRDNLPAPETTPSTEAPVENKWAEDREFHKHYVCAGCGRFITLPYEPTPGESVYCADCKARGAAGPRRQST